MRTKYTLGKQRHFNLVAWARGGHRRGTTLVFEVADSAPPVKVVVICIYLKQVAHKWNWGLSSGDHQDVLIVVPLALKSNEILPFSFLLLRFCCWTIGSSQIPCHKFSNNVWDRIATTVIGCWRGQDIDLGLISACDCHQLFILLLWYFEPEASLNYVANWSLFYVLFRFDF